MYMFPKLIVVMGFWLIFILQTYTQQTWTFNPPPDTYDPQAKLDLRYLNEKFAGEHGFIRINKEGDFIRGDGQPIRFWATHDGANKRDLQAFADRARFLAKRGVNLVRWHGQLLSVKEGSRLEDINQEAREKLWQYVAAMKKEGIYLVISPYYAHALGHNLPKSWNYPRSRENSLTGLLFFDETLQKAYKAWLRELLVPPNPYTGIPLKDEPAIAVIQIQNEDSLLFWTVGNIKGEELRLFQQKFGEYIIRKYGSLTQAYEKWQQTKLNEDDPTNRRLGFYHIWHFTLDGLTKQPPQNPGHKQRMADQIEFMTETMRTWHREVVRFLREEIRAKQLINAGNWKTADPVLLNDLERYSYTPTEVMAVNRYTGGVHVGPHAGWAICPGDRFTNRSHLTVPEGFPLALKQIEGCPFLITESNWVPPNYYQAEGPFLVALYQSLLGIDGFFWFCMGGLGETQWYSPDSANGYLRPSLGKWIAHTPEILGNFPANALLYRLNYVKRAPVAVHEYRPPQDLWNLNVPIISESGSFDPNRDAGIIAPSSPIKTVLDPLAFFTGPVLITYEGDARQNMRHPNLDQCIDRQRKIVKSLTGEIELDYGNGICKVNAPKVQGFAGFFKEGTSYTCTDIVLQPTTIYAVIVVVSMDQQPLRQSKKILIQIGTTCRPTNWKDKEVSWNQDNQQLNGYEIISVGEKPWQITSLPKTRLTLQNPLVKQAYILDMNGMATATIPLERKANQISIPLPETAKYVILE